MVRFLFLIAFVCAGLISAQASSLKKAFVIKRGKYQNLKAYASSWEKNSTPDNAFDGNASTYWVPKRIPCWIAIDFGKEVNISRIAWRGDRSGTYHKRIPEDYRFTGSLTGEFSKENFLICGAESNRKNFGVAHDFKPIKTRFVRMEIFRSYPERKWQPSIDEIDILPYPAISKSSEKIKIECKSAWRLFGIIEELRANGYKLPEHLDEIEKEICFKLNVARYFREGIYKERLKEALSIMNGMAWIKGTPKEYKAAKIPLAKKKTLPAWETKGYLKDKTLTVGLKSYPYLIDFNNDGIKDLLLGDHDGFVYIFINHGTNKQPVYREEKRLKSSSTGKDIAVRFNPKLNFADMNGDGKLDIVFGSYDGKPYMLPNEGKNPGEFVFDDHKYTTFKTENGVLDVGNYVYPFVVDWNRDGLPDIITGEIEGKVHLHLNKGTKSEPFFKAPVKIASISPDMYPDPAMFDINGDGKRDLVLGSRSGKVYFFENKGTDNAPLFSEHYYLQAGGKDVFVGRLSHIHFGDWNADGVIDLIVGNDHGEARVFPGKKKGAQTVFLNERLLKTQKEVELVSKVHPVVSFGDWNGDGKIDIIAGGEGPEIRFFPGAGAKAKPGFDHYELVSGVMMDAGAFKDHSSEEKVFWDNSGLEFITEYLGNASPEIVDWDNDGKLDLLVGNYAGLIYFYKNIGTKNKPKLAKPKALKAGGRLLRVGGFSTPRAVDWDGDGKLDLISGDLLGRVYVFMNKGSGNAPSLSQGRVVDVAGKDFTIGPRSIVEFADLNNDGLKDLLVGNRFGKVYALLNVGRSGKPEFTNCEILQDKSKIWEELYGGGWHGPRGHFPLKWKMGKDVSDMGLEATSCPRIVDFDNDGKKELIVSHRFGRIFIYPMP